MNTNKTLIVAYYKFVDLPDYKARKAPLLQVCQDNGVVGTILLASEGINSTMAGSETGVQAVLDFLQSDPAIGALTVKRSWDDKLPFYRMKVRLKEEIVRLGKPEVSPNHLVGQYVPPEQWNALISDPDVTLIDTRNDYEYELGTFQGAVDPQTTHFREFPAYVQDELADRKTRKVAMFCTGGIRCEKATAHLLNEGFEKVYHLQGGILNYLEKVDPTESLWQGDCFVFDNRVTVDHHLQPGKYIACPSCRHSLSEEDLQSDNYSEGISCPYCYATQTDDQRNRAMERKKQIRLSREHGRSHVGATESEFAGWRDDKKKAKSQS